MKPRNAFWAMLLAAGLGAIVAGCGGRSRDAAEEAPVDEASAPEAPGGEAEVATAAPESSAPAPKPAAPEAAPAPEAAAVAASGSAKAEDASATQEILQVSLKVFRDPAPKPTGPAPTATATATASSDPAAAYANPQPGPVGSSGAADSATAGAANVAESNVGIYTGEAGSSGPGGVAGSGPGADKPGDYSNPASGVVSFFNALKAKNIDGLAEAVALHAPGDAAPANQKLFRSLLDTSIADEDLSNLATDLDGYEIVDIVPSRISTGSVGVLLRKFVPSQSGMQGSGTVVARTITMRREQAGWKVLDISSAKSSPVGLQPGRGRGRR